MKILLINRSATFNYFLSDVYEAGIVLTGGEVKSLIKSQGNIKDAYVIFKKNEAFVLNMHISKYDFDTFDNYDETRTRKLLLHKNEIIRILNKLKKDKLTVVVTKVYVKKRKIKLEIALAKGKKLFDKRETIKERDIKRSFKNYNDY